MAFLLVLSLSTSLTNIKEPLATGLPEYERQN